MMKKYISLFIVFVLALSLGGGVVRAEEEKSGPKNQREEFRLKMQAERKAFVEKMQTERATFLAEGERRRSKRAGFPA